jgi:hypothetical protein
MTISSTTRINGPYISGTALPVTFKVFTAADLQVIRLNTSTGTETTLVLNSDYTVTLNGDQNTNPGGTVTLVVAASATSTVTITSDIANLQPTDLTNQGGFYPEVITDSLDRATIQIQQIADIGDRTLKIPISDGTLNMELPTKTERANSFLSFDANGLPSVVTAGSSGAPATITRQVFSGTGSQTVFTLASDPGAVGNSAQVYIGGVYQQRSTYTIAGTTLTFSQAPVAGTNNIEFVNFLTSNIGATSADLVTYTPSGTGAVARSAASKMGDVVSVKDFGAVGDGVADDTAAIQAAANYCETAGARLFGASGTYKISSTVSLNCSGDLSQMTISCPGATVSPAIQVGKTTGSLFGIRLNLILPKVTNSSKTAPGWTGFDLSVGVDIGNLYYSQITVTRVYGFGINLYVGGHTIGNAYNNYTIWQLLDGKVNCKIGARSVSAWSNENNYYCGAFSRSSSEGTSPITGAYSVWFDGITGTQPNNNVFYKPSVETDSDEFQFNFENSNDNLIISPRFEVTGGGRIRFNSTSAGATSGNTFLNGYNTVAPTVTFAGSSSPLNKYYGTRTGDALEFTGNGIAIVNNTSSGVANPHIQGFAPGQRALSKSASSTDWTYRLFSDGMQFKQSADSFARIAANSASSANILLGGGSAAPDRGIGISGTGVLVLNTPTSSGVVRNNANNATSLGNASFLWSEVFAGTPTINTSDGRSKVDVASLSDAERRVAQSVKGIVRKFRYADAVEKKGDGARIHVGVVAQDVIAAFAAEGLDAMRYGMVCYDEWPAEIDENGTVVVEAGNRYGVRYSELLAFIIAAI